MDDTSIQPETPDVPGEPWRGRRHRFGGSLVGLFVVLVGVLFLLRNLGVVYVEHLWAYWPVILIALGIARLVDSRRAHGRLWGGMVAAAGVLLLAANLGRIPGNVWNYIWPVLIIWFGINMLIGRGPRGRGWERRRDPLGAGHNWSTGATGISNASSDYLREVAVFGGIRKRISSRNFQGGEVKAVFGGVELDLRPAMIAKDEIEIEADSVFGGVDITVPETWRVAVEGQGLFGGYEDKTHHSSTDQGGPRVLITGSAVFGGVTVKN
jgi:predicted membrane protein